MRITVSLIVNLVANGTSTQKIIRDYPYLEPVIILRLRNMQSWRVNQYLNEVIKRFQKQLKEGALISVSEGQIRVRALPIGRSPA